MFRSLTVTSPRLMRGPDVTRCQQLLAHNPYGDFHPGAVDSEYGVMTAAAVRRAKFWLGRPMRRIDGVWRQELAMQLAGHRKLTVRERVRRKLRLAAPKPIGPRLIREMTKYLGVKESPAGSNNTVFTRAYMGSTGREWTSRHPGPPWCAILVWYCLRAIGFKLDRSVNWAYVPSILAAARDGRAGLSIVPHPEVGALACFDWEHDGIADHVGVITGVGPGSSFVTCEGNTSTSNDSDGGEVMRRIRDTSQAAGFVRIHNQKG